MDAAPWYPPEDAKWKVARDMRRYIIGYAHFKWAVRFMYGFVRMQYVDGKWKGALQNPYACGNSGCHVWLKCCVNDKDEMVFCGSWRPCQHEKKTIWHICEYCRKVYDRAKLVDTLIAADLSNDRDLCFSLDRVKEAFALYDPLKELFNDGLHYGYRGPYDILLNIKPVILRLPISRDVCECGWLLDHDAEHCWKCECGKDCTFGNCKTQVYRIVERDSDYIIANVLRREKPPTIDYQQEEFDE